jgi:hypothetical protein
MLVAKRDLPPLVLTASGQITSILWFQFSLYSTGQQMVGPLHWRGHQTAKNLPTFLENAAI